MDENECSRSMIIRRSGLDDAHGQRPQVAQRATDWFGRMSHKEWIAVAEFVGRRVPPFRQLDVAGMFKLQQQCTGRHILESALCIAPVPAMTKLLADPRSAPVRVFHQERSNQPDVFGV